MRGDFGKHSTGFGINRSHCSQINYNASFSYMHQTGKGPAPFAVWLTGLPAAGKTTIALEAARQVSAAGYHAYVLDGDVLRSGLNADLGFSREDRAENMGRIVEVARLLIDAGVIVFCSVIAPFRADRELARQRAGRAAFIEVHVSTPLAVCMARDPKSLYARALRGEIKNMTGVDHPYEPPEAPDFRIDATATPPEVLAAAMLDELSKRGLLSLSHLSSETAGSGRKHVA